MALRKVAAASDIPAGEVRRFEVDGRLVAVANLGEEGFRAVDAICSHAQYYLDEGEVDVDFKTIECPKHGSTFDLKTGRPRSLPAILPVKTYGVRVVDDDVVVEVMADVAQGATR